ncbi:MAG: hypothetical protein JO087_05930 [Actinobacteria bacterium]|nr:hypothetical protein [Actinomycetota bacterium]
MEMGASRDTLDGVELPQPVVSVDEFLRRSAEEQDRLRAEIHVVRGRIETAASRAAAAQGSADVHALLLDAQSELARLDAEHQEALQSVRDGALAEAARVIDDARRRAALVRARGEQLLRTEGG